MSLCKNKDLGMVKKVKNSIYNKVYANFLF